MSESSSGASPALGLWGRMLQAYARVVIARPWLLFGITLLTLVPAALLASRLALRTSFIDLLSHDDPEVAALDRVLDKSGGLGFALIAIPSDDLPRAKQLATDLDPALAGIDGVRFVQARLDASFFEDKKLYFLDAKGIDELTRATKEAIDYRIMSESDMLLDDSAPPDPFARIRAEAGAKAPVEEFLIGKDGRYLYVLVGLSGAVGDLDKTTSVEAEVERVATKVAAEREPGLTLRFTGPVVNRREDARTLREDLARAGALGAVVIVALVVGTLRSGRAMLLLAIPLVIGLAWTFAFAYLAVGTLNAVSGFLVSILSGLGIEYGIHLYRRYWEERRLQGADAATTRVLTTTGGWLVSACLVNAAVFAVVAVTGFRGFMEFGLIASVGMVLTMVATLLTFPALNLLIDRRWPMKIRAARPLRPLRVPATLRYALVIIVPILALLSGAAVLAGRVEFKTDWRKLGADTAASRFDAYVLETMGPSMTQAILYLDDARDVGEVRAAIESVRERRTARQLPFNIVSVVGLDDLVPPDQPAKEQSLAKLGAQIERVKRSWLKDDERPLLERARRLAAARPFTVEDVPPSLQRRFATVDGRGTLAVLTSDAVLEESTKIIDFGDQIAELRAELASRHVGGSIASENAVAGRIFRIIQSSGIRILLATFVVLYLVLLLEFRRPLQALAVLSSVAVGMLLMGGGMVLFHIELNFMNAAVLPIVVGVSLDNAIHVFHRFRAEGPRSIPLVLRRVGSAVLLSSATNAAGFAALLIARHGGLRSVAVLSIVGISATVFSTAVYFPLVLDFGARASERILAWKALRSVRS